MLTPAEYHQHIYHAMTEKEWQQQVVDTAHTLGYLAYHTYDSRRCEPGFMDLVLTHLIRPRFILIECKTEKGRLTRAQKLWLARAQASGVEAYVMRPHQFDELVEILRR